MRKLFFKKKIIIQLSNSNKHYKPEKKKKSKENGIEDLVSNKAGFHL